MNYCRYLLLGFMTILVSGCGQMVKESLKVQPATINTAGAGKTVVILPFADYSQADNLESAYRRNLLITENITDRLTSSSFHMPVQEDVFLYLVNQNIISLVAYEKNNTALLEDELHNEWSSQMKGELKRYIDLNKTRNSNVPVLDTPGTHGLSGQEVVKIGRYFSADYIMRGRIVEYKEREDPTWNPLQKGIISFVTGASSKIAFGQARADKYDEWGNMIAGATYGALYGDWDPKWPYTGRADQTIFGVSGGTMGNTIVWGAIGGGLGHMAKNSGKIPQAVVQLRIWVQDAYTGDVVWTNRVDVKVSPQSILADYQYDQLFESATEKAVTSLIDNFAASL